MAEYPPRRESNGLNTLVTLGIAALVVFVLFYAEQDWQGAKDLAEAKARWKAAGYSLNAASYYPAPLPNDQNLAALPIFDLEPNPTYPDEVWTRRLHDATDEDQHGGDLYDYDHKLGLAERVAKAYAKKFPGRKQPASALAQFEELYPFIGDLRIAAATRPIFRLNLDYAHKPEWDRSLGPVTMQISVAKLLSNDAELALGENKPQVALKDVQLAFEIARGTASDPSLVGGLVTAGICAITRANIDDALEKHGWSDAQLAAVQDELKRLDFLLLYPFDMRSEAAARSLPMYEWSREQPSVMDLIMSLSAGGMGRPKSGFVGWLLWHLWARGWWDMNAAQTIDFTLDATHGVDLKARLVDRKKPAALELRIEKIKEHPGPWNILYGVASGAMTGGMIKFAEMQVELDEDRIVCALERYRLAHGIYPSDLAALVPAYIDELPHDVMNGAPYHYRLNVDGTFLLYSVGWNQVDDGGKFAFRTDSPKSIDYENGDWVWPMFKK